MAQKIVYVDDIDGTEGAKPQSFGVNGDTWEIDLSDENTEKLHSALAPFIDKARKVAKTAKPAPAKRAPRGRSSELAEIREWAKSNGHRVTDRGRIPQAVVDAYNAR